MKALSVATYAALKSKVRATLLLGQRKIEEAKVQTYWDTGRYINQHIQACGGRAEYGKKVILKLSGDLGVGDELLYRCSRFAGQFPISSSWRKLSWSHLRALCRIPDDRKRLELSEQASQKAWSSEFLETKVRNLLWDERAQARDGKPPSLLPVPKLGPFYTYPVIRPETVHSVSRQLLLDLGFSARLEMDLFPGAHFSAGTIVTSTKDAKGRYALSRIRSQKGDESLLYTYKAFVTRVIDGDTLIVEFRLGFGQIREETLRLKGIDCPELDTPEGQAAKRFVERELAHCEFITVKSTQTRKEKWGRYLGDVFYTDKAGKQQYLNNRLLEEGHAVRVRD